jgi:hypothetical protein
LNRMYLWDEILDFWLFHRSQVLLGVAAVAALVVGLFTYQHATCCTRRPPLQCMLFDVSGSALHARETYSTLDQQIIQEQSEQDGSVCFMDVYGAPTVEGNAETMYVGAENPGNSSAAALERKANQLKARERIDELLQHPPLRVPGSAFVEALSMVGPMVHSGETIDVFSDANQNSHAFALWSLWRQKWSEQSIEAALSRLKREGWLPSMPGVRVVFYKPGFQGEGARPSIVPVSAIRRFWEAWGRITGAEVTLT